MYSKWSYEVLHRDTSTVSLSNSKRTWFLSKAKNEIPKLIRNMM